MDTFNVINQGLFRTVGAPAYGEQDTGQSPGGPVDRFAMQSGNIMIGNPDFAPALEIIFQPVLEFKHNTLFVITGAKCTGMKLSKAASNHQSFRDVHHARVEVAEGGDRLSFGEKEYGFRIYLCHAPVLHCHSPDLDSRIGRTRAPYREINTSIDPEGIIRVVEGPEYACLSNPEVLLDHPVLTTREMSDMGIRLASTRGERPIVNMGNMVSEAVNDGTIQATPQGPIVLLRNRPTIGGYPRILNVIGPDIDLLGQLGPDQLFRFRKISIPEALAAAQLQTSDLNRFRSKWSTRQLSTERK
jgi:allophanate hydrolase subunit 2